MNDDDFDPPAHPEEAKAIRNSAKEYIAVRKKYERDADIKLSAIKRGELHANGRIPPHSLEAEEYLLSAAMLDGDSVIPRCIEKLISAQSFFLGAHATVFERLLALHASHKSTETAVVAEDLKTNGFLDSVGGYAFLTQISSKIPTTAQSEYFIETVARYAMRRDLIRQATAIAEECYNATDGDDLIESAKFRISSIKSDDGPRSNGESPSAFIIPPDGDPSILLGDRFLNRGDGGIFVSGAGMGKSSASIQMAYIWALNQDFFGIKSNGGLKSLMIQSEDSRGDIAEARVSVEHGLKLNSEDLKLIDKNVVIVTERVRRGARFIAELRRLIKLHKPDLVWINPLVAFMDGDLTAAKDVGAFLREGLNSLNEPPTFGFIIVHHTTKPATGKEKSERTWNEEMYDMGGSYEIPGWARFVVNLRAGENTGEFNLILSKRGSRAGVVNKVPQGAGFRDVVVTKIPIKWAQGAIEIEGRAKKMPLIFWEPREMLAAAKEEPRELGNDETLTTYLAIFPKDEKDAQTSSQLHRNACLIRKVSMNQFQDLLLAAARDGFICATKEKSGVPKYYLL